MADVRGGGHLGKHPDIIAAPASVRRQQHGLDNLTTTMPSRRDLQRCPVLKGPVGATSCGVHPNWGPGIPRRAGDHGISSLLPKQRDAGTLVYVECSAYDHKCDPLVEHRAGHRITKCRGLALEPACREIRRPCAPAISVVDCSALLQAFAVFSVAGVGIHAAQKCGHDQG